MFFFLRNGEGYLPFEMVLDPEMLFTNQSYFLQITDSAGRHSCTALADVAYSLPGETLDDLHI